MTTNTTETPARLRGLSVLSHSVQNGGGTFDRLGNPVTSGVAVTTTVLDTIEGRCIEPDELAGHLTYSLGEGSYLGTWFDTENDRWEISETAVFAKREDALAVGRMLDERYVYDIDADECVATS